MVVENIVRFLEHHEIPQEQLCQQTGLPPNSFQIALQGEKKLSLEEYEKICQALNVPYDLFFETN